MSQLDLNLDDSLEDDGPMESDLSQGPLSSGPIATASAPMAPARGVLIKKPPTTIYTMLMVVATVAMVIGCIFLAMEKARYGL